ncbi:UBX domain-containing protein 11 isoform X2 [Thalassophryne amazonica]|uniref:UBX domain-containing protein 11 isoform X2 n=1 Tax=Thalassophryne amazonica TaxID=390379 RepID=UPI00147096DA|nr:UBX domain-containing protein 11 isoform X2 [Thalassophryne amazonica]
MMSSPLSLLKKTRRAALPTSDKHKHRSSEGLTIRREPAGTPPSDLELMSAAIQRVNQLEARVRSQAQEIKRKDKHISALEDKLRHVKESARARDQTDGDDFVLRYQQLQKQVQEMEASLFDDLYSSARVFSIWITAALLLCMLQRFLSDYGLMWVGDTDTRDASDSLKGSLTEPGTTLEDFHMNFDLVLKRIRELNALVGEGESFIQATATGARLAQKDPIRLRLYSNGIVMFDGPFRSYQEHSTQQCMQDLMDGYFPSELQDRFPDGVPFQVDDRREEEYIAAQPWAKFPGKGQAPCGGILKAITSENPGKTLSMDQFQNRLPKVVVKSGQVIDMRDSVKADLQGSSVDQKSKSSVLINTPTLQAVNQRLPSTNGVVTMKVKSEDGHHTYLLKMCFSETIGHLRQYLDNHRGVSASDYDIISMYPQRRYVDDSQTLLSCGLTTNAYLLLKTRQHTKSTTAQ